MEFLDKVTDSLDNHDSVDVIFLDFAKAFDKVPHCRLLDKIAKHGIDGKVLAWIKELLHASLYLRLRINLERSENWCPAGISFWTYSF